MKKTFPAIRKVLGLLTMLSIVHASYSTSLFKDGDRKPNIVFIYADDLGWTDLGISGSSYYETPNIDRLAEDGLRFTNAYSIGPNCAPSRASLLTGLYPPRHGIFTVGTAERGDSTKRKLIPIRNNTVLAPAFITIAEELKNAGYVTALIGKWQLGNADHQADAGSQGFDHVVSGAPGTPAYFYPYHKGNADHHQGLEEGKTGEYLTDRLTAEALDFVKDNRDRPFFLYLSHFAVHTPIEAKPPKTDKYKKKAGNEYHNNPEYAAMIESLDESVGKVVNTLDSLGLSDNTIVIFYSDNGGMGVVTTQNPLRGAKGMLYEGGIRVPLIVKSPIQRAKGTSEVPVLGIDFYPTLLELVGIENPLNPVVDGKSFVQVLAGEKMPERDLFWHFPAYLEAYRGDGHNKDPFRTTPVSLIRSGNYKLLEFYEDGRQELYDLSKDIGEKQDLSQSHPEVLRELHKKLLQWKTELNAPEPTELNPHYKP